MTEKYTLEEAFDLHDELTGTIADAIGQAVERVDVLSVLELLIPAGGEIGPEKTPHLYAVADLIAKWLMQQGYIVRPEEEVEQYQTTDPTPKVSVGDPAKPWDGRSPGFGSSSYNPSYE